MELRRSPAVWTTQGIAVHAAIELWEKSHRSETLENALAHYSAKWDALIESQKRQEPNLSAWTTGSRKTAEKDIEDRYIIGRKQVEAYFEYAERDPLRVWVPPGGIPAVEMRFEVDFGGVTVLGYIDLVMEDPKDGSLLVRDIKTGSKRPIGVKQLVVYRWAIKKMFGLDPQWGDFWMAKDAAPTPKVYLGNRNQQQVEAWFQMMDYAESSGVYLSNESSECRILCDVSQYCPDMGGRAPEGVSFLGT